MTHRSLEDHLREQERIRQPKPSGRAKRMVSGIISSARSDGLKSTGFTRNLVADKERALLRYIAELEAGSEGEP